MHYVFVYGTLKEGFPNHCLMNGSRRVAEATLHGFAMYSIGGYYPGVVRGIGRITGEVYEVNDLTVLDRLEANGRLYQRELVPVEAAEGVIEAWIYLYLGPLHHCERIGETWTMEHHR